MRIIFILPDLPLSGAATRTVHLAEHLVGEGNNVVVVTIMRAIDGSLKERLRRSGVEVISLAKVAGLRRASQWMIGSETTIVHAAMPSAGLVGLLLARIFRHPVVYSYTNCIHIQRPLRTLSIREHIKSSLEQVMAARCDALHAVAGSVATQLLRAYPRSEGRVYTVPYRITPPASGDGRRGWHDVDAVEKSWPKLLCVGRLVPHKRVEDAIRAIAFIREALPKVRLIVLGAGPERRRLVSLAADLTVSENVVFMGESSNPDRLFDWANILLHPSLYEGYPRVFAEAIAKRIPIVSIDAPYAREVAQAGVSIILARPMDASSLATKIVEATRLTEFDRVHDGAYMDTGVAKLLELYLQLADCDA